jgi:hypothetical protein
MWFIKQALKSLLPHEWTREQARGRTYYHNAESAITTEKHPMLYRFRAAFNRLVTNNVQLTLETKSAKTTLKRKKLYGPGDISVLNSEQQHQIFEILCSKRKKFDEDPYVLATREATDFYELISEDMGDT